MELLEETLAVYTKLQGVKGNIAFNKKTWKSSTVLSPVGEKTEKDLPIGFCMVLWRGLG